MLAFLRWCGWLNLVAVLIGTSGAMAAEMLYPLGSVKSSDGSLFIVDLKLHGVWQSKEGALTKYFEGSPKYRTPLNAPRCIAFDKAGKLLVGDSATREVYRFDEPGKPIPLTKGSIGIPTAIAVHADGTVFVTDLELHRIYKIAAGAEKAEEFIAISAPRGLTFDADGQLIVLSMTKNQVYRVSAEGKSSVLVPDRPFNFPHNIVLGPDKLLYVIDGYEKTLWRIAADGKVEKVVSGAPFVNPVGLIVVGEKFLVTDPRANGVFEVDLQGKVTQVDVGK